LCDIGCFANKHDAFAVDGEAGVPDYAALGVDGDGSAAEQDQVDDLFVTLTVLFHCTSFNLVRTPAAPRR
jgi:hypothetical protein